MNYAKGFLRVRKEAGLSQHQLAKLVGVDNSYISRLESGERKPSVDFFEKVAKLLGWRPWELFLLCSPEFSELTTSWFKRIIYKLR